MVQAKPGAYTVVDDARVDTCCRRRGAHSVLVLARPCQQGDETSCWIDFLDVPFVQHSEAMFFEPNPAEARRSPCNGPSPHRIPAREALGPGSDAKDVEIAKGALPTIGLHLLRLPSGTRRQLPKTTVNNLYSVIGGQARVEIDGGVEKISRSAT